MTSAFRHCPIKKKFWKYLVMKAKNPEDGKFYYFVDKNMPFGASISCSHFQAFSDAVSHIVKVKSGKSNVNYLDDFLFAALLKLICNEQLRVFLQVCAQINFPVSLEKTFWAATRITFLGLLIDTVLQIICVPIEKITKALDLIDQILNNKSKKVTLKKLQQLTGFLNFLGKSIVPGRAFTRRLYAHGAGVLKPHHHIKVNQEMRLDLEMWREFLHHPAAFSRQFFDYNSDLTANILDFYTDASTTTGCGGYFRRKWFIILWEDDFITECNPSINYLELYAVVVGVTNWIDQFTNQKITLFCDNQSVVHMINNNSSKCKNCMVLIRFLVLLSLKHNVKITASHVRGEANKFADFLSRGKYKQFRQLAREEGRSFERMNTPVPQQLWPMQKLWLK